MNKIIIKSLFILIISLFFISGNAMAHDGHDHSHPQAWIAHLVWAVSIFAVGYIGFLFIKSKAQHNSQAVESNDAL